MLEDFSVTVPGTNFILKSNSSYRVEGKVSKSSPIEYQKKGFTKIPEPLGVEKAGEQVKVRFDPKRNIWDTGFYETSPCYIRNKISPEEIKKTVATLQKYLIPHLEESLEEGALSNKPSNNYFDKEEGYEYYVNQKSTYTTKTAEDFWGLWNAVLNYVVAPEKEQNKLVYKSDLIGTPFIITDSLEKKNQTRDNVFEKTKASSTFMSMLISKKPTDKELLVDISNYTGFKLSATTGDKIAVSQFNNWITNTQDALSNIESFNKNVEYFINPKNKEELEIYKDFNTALKNGVITEHRNEYFLKEESLGMNKKIAAQKINKNKALKKTLLEEMS